MNVLITGSAGLIGSAATQLFLAKDFIVHGVDNNSRAQFFGEEGSTDKIKQELEKQQNYTHHQLDIRDAEAMKQVFKDNNFDVIIHTAAQPSHDWSGKFPVIDFEINAFATVQLLELAREFAPDASFIFTSSSKVYGDHPNNLPLIESESRYDLPQKHELYHGVPETMSVDHSMHSPYGAGKLAADVMVQEFGRYYGMKTTVLRCNCLTGPAHAGAKLHGFLSYLVKCIVRGEEYVVNGYKGKQVRDNIHADDLVAAMYEVAQKPGSGVVYNIGGSRENSVSILEAIKLIEEISGKTAKYTIAPEARRGDHIWYISDNRNFQKAYPNWNLKYPIKKVLTEMIRALS